MRRSSTMIAQLGRESLTRIALVFGVGALVIAVYWQSYSSMLWQWNRSDHSHGLVVVPLVIFLIWRCRSDLVGVSIKPSLWGMSAVFLLVPLWILARLTAVQVVEHAVAIALIPAFIVATLGRELASRIAFPLLFLGFALPVSDAFVPFLVEVTADISSFLLSVFGVPAYREGRYLTLPGASFVIADVCSGVRYLMAGLMVTTLFGYLHFRSIGRQLLFAVSAAVILIIANGVRAFIVMAIASASNLKYLGGKDHILFGWLLFAIVVFTFLWLGSRYADKPSMKSGERSADNEAEHSKTRHPIRLTVILVVSMLIVTIRPFLGEYGAFESTSGFAAFLMAVIVLIWVLSSRDKGTHGGNSALGTESFLTFIPAVIAAAALLAGPFSVNSALRVSDASQATINIESIPGCEGPREWREDWRPAMSGAVREALATFSCDSATLNVFVAAYADLEPGKELISSSNQIFPEVWSRYSRGLERLSGVESNNLPVLEQQFELPSGETRTWHWYVVDSHQETSGAMVKARQLWALLGRRPDGGRVVVIAVRNANDSDQARKLLAAAAGQLPSAYRGE